MGEGEAVGLAVGLSVGSGDGPKAGLPSKMIGRLQEAMSNPERNIKMRVAWRLDRMAASYGM